MASPGNPNQQQQQQHSQTTHFDLQKLFKATTAAATTTSSSSPSPTIPNPLPSSNLNSSPSFPAPSPSTPPPSSYPTPSSSYPPPTGTYPYHHPHFLPYPTLHHHQQQQEHPLILHHLPQMHAPQRSPIFQAPSPSPSSPHLPSSPNPTNTTSGARLMALLGTQNPPSNQDSSVVYSSSSTSSPSPVVSDFSMPSNPAVLPPTLSSASPVNLASPQSTPTRMLSSKLPKGRHLMGEHVVYDIDVRMPGEMQPQLEVTPITKYASDPGLVLGRQIAVNRSYICYGLKLGAIRVLNINTALRYLLRGHTQRVTDMAFFAEDLHLLASASTDGRIFIWKINEGPDEEDKPQITGKVILAIQILGESESVHPRVCWHPHKPEILMVAIGNRILKIDTMKAGKGETFSAEEPLKCSVDKLIDGVHLIGKHDNNVTELSMCQWMKSRLASASADGTVKIWEERKSTPLAVLRPHDGKPVNSVTFLTAPHRPDHIVLITTGPLNQEVKIWVSDNEEGWLLPSDSESWNCIQTLDIRSSSEANPEDAFFNQVVALPRAGLFLLANAKKNTIYAVHIEYGPNPTATRMDYIAEFIVTMPILSLTGTSDSLPDGEHIVQIYCVQTQAIQQYGLNLSQCLPPPLDNVELEKTDSNLSRAFDALDGSTNLETGNMAQLQPSSSESTPIVSPAVNLPSDISGLPEASVSSISDTETKPNELPSRNGFEHIHTAPPPLPLSPRLSQKLSGFKNSSNNLETSSMTADHSSEQANLDSSEQRRMESEKDNIADVPASGDNLRKDDKIVQNDVSVVSNAPTTFKHPTHLVTPSEIFSKTALSSDNSHTSQGMNVQDVAAHSNAENFEVEVKVVGETGSNQEKTDYERERDSHTNVAERKEKLFYSQASDLDIQMARETYNIEGVRQADNTKTIDAPDQSCSSVEEEAQDTSKDVPTSISESETVAVAVQSPAPAVKGKRQKGKNSQVSGASSSSPSPFNSTDSSNDQGGNSGGTSMEAALPQLSAMQEMMGQLLSMQKEMQKQMNGMVSVPVTKEGKRLEGSLGRNMEKVVKAHSDALWARLQEENAKQEKLERDRMQQITNLISNYVNKDMASLLEKIIKKEISSIGTTITRSISQIIEKTISSSVTESFQKGVGDKALNQLEKSVSSKLEATVSRQIQAQFQTSGKQALQEALRTSLEASIIPAFEMSCKAMFEQIDVAFQNGLVKHATAIQQQYDSTHSPLAMTLRDTINSASSITQTLSGQLADGQRKLLAIAANSNVASDPFVAQINNGLHEMTEDPTKELSRLISEGKFEEAFTGALHRSDVSLVSWLCSQVDLAGILSMVPLPLTQGVLLSLLQQLSCGINTDTPRKLAWMTDVAAAINPADPRIAAHVRRILDQVYRTLGHHRTLPTTSPSEASTIRLLMHVINSVLLSCK
ncbi:enhancer of mRNA-decapping protein 4-like isoform X1 [Abrus precatorius]|uniref:Enhancer of mRNA-decapping protein 4-like isoform X1 n=1 Tax=Abrus precatorius TaxID=3816 RepID=A0A8B8LTY4_ABRPR|nr:enhancer of mRNA-decapping protein 4-like isoform X1 [Abrus precatorius]